MNSTVKSAKKTLFITEDTEMMDSRGYQVGRGGTGDNEESTSPHILIKIQTLGDI